MRRLGLCPIDRRHLELYRAQPVALLCRSVIPGLSRDVEYYADVSRSQFSATFCAGNLRNY